eukprot:1155501-Pelagomonas_calceolata.AAC.1
MSQKGRNFLTFACTHEVNAPEFSCPSPKFNSGTVHIPWKATQQTLSKLPLTTGEEFQRSVQAAKDAFMKWRGRHPDLSADARYVQAARTDPRKYSEFKHT